MVGFDDNFYVTGELLNNSRVNLKKRSKAEFDNGFSLQDIKNEDTQEKQSCSRGALRERIAARSGFNAPRLNIENIVPPLTLSPDTLLESPVFLSNPLPSPTTGKLSTLPFDEVKDEVFHDIATSLPFQSISSRCHVPTNMGLEPDEFQDYDQRELCGLGDSLASNAPADDGYNWRKYGQKLVKGSEYPRSYYKCTHPNCEVKKKVERSREGHITEIIYIRTHHHPKPRPDCSGIVSSGTDLDVQLDGTEQTKQEGFAGTKENTVWTSPVYPKVEYGSPSESMQVHSMTQFGYGDATADTLYGDEDEEDHLSQMIVPLGRQEVDESEPKRRKLEDYASKIGSTRTTCEPKIVLETPSDIDILEDGYRWRKYGQKVVKGNQNPRSYYKCTANGCTVIKHVERASDDFNNVLTTYIGRHNHNPPATRNSSHVGSGSAGILQDSLVTQTQFQNHVHYPMPHSRSEGLVTANSSPFGFQSHTGPPGYSYIVQPQLSNFLMPGLANGEEMLPNPPAPAFGDPDGLMLLFATKPQVEQPMSQSELQMLRSSLIYSEIMSRLPQL